MANILDLRPQNSFKRGVLIQPRLEKKGEKVRVVYDTNPYDAATGVLRSIQKFCIIMLTTKGTDIIRPWFGTRFPELLMMNIVEDHDMNVFIKDQFEDARDQFFDIQSADTSLVAADLVTAIELTSVEILRETGTIIVTVRFYPKVGEAITISLTP